MIILPALKAASTLSDLADLLQLRPAALSYILFKLPPQTKYRTFEIPKRSGGTRTIKAPADSLKVVQRRLSTLLQDCVDEINQAKGRRDRVAHGFKRQKSIVTNGREHRNRRYVFNVDLEDFFPSINLGRVRGFFLFNRDFQLTPAVATTIAQIACHDNCLPQGSPSSPVISNLIANILDMHLVRLSSTVGCTYSRYADDLTFSTNKALFPPEIAHASKGPDLWEPSLQFRALIRKCGFSLNAAKTRMQYRTSRQEVTGLVVNKKINVRNEYRHNVRAMVHKLLNTGSFQAYGRRTDASGNITLSMRDGTLDQLHGMLGFIDVIDLENRRNDTPRGLTLSSKERAYQRFLIYKNFYAPPEPVILCEGETDNLYLTHAIRSLAAEYPGLAAISPDGKIRLKVRLYKNRHSSTARILGLRDGGSSQLSKFIATYKKEIAKFRAPGQGHAFIILSDNDSGAGPIRSAVKQTCGKSISALDSFIHVYGNLYVLLTPLPDGAQSSKIEDFFANNLKATVVAGKRFDDSNDSDSATHYGKKIFAHKVVRPNADSIDFSGFRTLLRNIVAAIEAHAAKKAGGAAAPGS
jgi:RNA-directed DNA polymerase